MNLNKAQLIGNLTRDPELRTTPQGQQVASFSVATSQSWKDASGAKQERTEFHNIVAWGKLADICKQFLGKGRKVYIEGRIQTRQWEKDGQKKQRTEIVAEQMIILDRAPQGSNGPAPAAAAPSDTGKDDAGYAAARGGTAAPEEEVKVEDIPF